MNLYALFEINQYFYNTLQNGVDENSTEPETEWPPKRTVQQYEKPPRDQQKDVQQQDQGV